jgi:hypothetical protein
MNTNQAVAQQQSLDTINVKLHTQSKIKRLREVPATFEALKLAIETRLYENEKINQLPTEKDYHIQYIDGDKECINVSDDDDLYSAYQVAQKELGGNIKFSVVRDSKESKEEKPKKEKKDKKERVCKKGKKECKRAKRADLEEEKISMQP